MQRHSWRETDGDDTTFWRADHHGGRWAISRQDDDGRWQRIDPIENEHWEKLRDVLWRKYQRKRCSWNLIAKIDKILGRTDEN